MERAGRVLAKSARTRQTLGREELVKAAWNAAVGRRLAARTRPVGLVRERLVVEVQDALWQKNLFGLRSQILRNLAEIAGADAPSDIEFRVGIPRRPPVRELPAAARGADEADLIADPVLGRLYRYSRRKAGA